MNHTFTPVLVLQIIYSSYSCTQGWFCTPCVSNPGLRLVFPVKRAKSFLFYLSQLSLSSVDVLTCCGKMNLQGTKKHNENPH